MARLTGNRCFTTFLLFTVVSVSIISTSTACVFTPVNNDNFITIADLHSHFHDNSDSKILDYHLSFHNVSDNFDIDELAKNGWADGFQPDRWFRSQGEENSHLLLLRHVYFGLLWRYMDIGIHQIDVPLSVSPFGCVETMSGTQLRNALMAYLLTDFGVDPETYVHPYSISEEIYICYQHIEDVDDWGRLQYRCCRKHPSLGTTVCHEIHEDEWIWAMHIAVFIATVIVFLFLPYCIPNSYKSSPYIYRPPDDFKFNFILSTDPDAFDNVSSAQILRPKLWKKMETFKNLVSKLKPDVMYTTGVTRMIFNIGMDKVLAEGVCPVSIWRSFFETFVRCKIRHSDMVETCCKTPCCGLYCCRCCPMWINWLRALRTIIVFLVLAVPAMPLMYAWAADGLTFQELDDAVEDLGYERSYNFYPGSVLGKVIVVFLAFMYLLNIVILVIDGATDDDIGRLYSDVLEVVEKGNSVKDKITRTRRRIKHTCGQIRKCGIFLLPLWIVLLCLVPVYMLLRFILNSPTMKIFKESFIRLWYKLQMFCKRKRPKGYDDTGEDLCEMFWFLVTLVFVILVLAVSINFLFYVAAMIIVKIVVDAQLVYKALPVCILLLLYLRDSFTRVGALYLNFHNTLLNTIKVKEEETIKKQSMLSWSDQESMILRVDPKPVIKEEDSVQKETKTETKRVVQDEIGYAVLTKFFDPEAAPTPPRKNLFLVKNGGLRMHLKQLLLFFNKNDILYTSKKFIFSCASINCEGAPGTVEENYVYALFDFMKIGTFLFFLFLVLMAYGTAYDVSATNQMFMTLITGLIPLLLRTIVLKRGSVACVSASDYRFEAQLRERIEKFSQTWNLIDIEFSDTVIEATPTKNDEDMKLGSDEDLHVPRIDLDKVDLVLDVSQEFPDLQTTSIYVSRNRNFRPPNSKVGVMPPGENNQPGLSNGGSCVTSQNIFLEDSGNVITNKDGQEKEKEKGIITSTPLKENDENTRVASPVFFKENGEQRRAATPNFFEENESQRRNDLQNFVREDDGQRKDDTPKSFKPNGGKINEGNTMDSENDDWGVYSEIAKLGGETDGQTNAGQWLKLEDEVGQERESSANKDEQSSGKKPKRKRTKTKLWNPQLDEMSTAITAAPMISTANDMSGRDEPKERWRDEQSVTSSRSGGLRVAGVTNESKDV